MRSTNRDYFLSTLSVLHSQRHSIIRTLQDMDLRLEELEESLIMMFDQQEENNIDMMLDDAWQAGFDYNKLQEELAMIDYEEDAIIYDTLRKKVKLCLCDECWGVCDCGVPDYRMD